MREELAAASARGGAVYLDALDVAARLEPALFRVLDKVLSTAQARHVDWRLGCRPAAWSSGLGVVGAPKVSAHSAQDLIVPARRPEIWLWTVYCGRSARFSRRSRLIAASMRARWVNACGKLPICSPVSAISSEYRPRWFA